jgi:hypothetical protein
VRNNYPLCAYSIEALEKSRGVAVRYVDECVGKSLVPKNRKKTVTITEHGNVS